MNDRSIVPLSVPTSTAEGSLHFHFASGFSSPNTRIVVRLLGPCFQTGLWKPFRQDRECVVKKHLSRILQTLHSFAVQIRRKPGNATCSLAERIVLKFLKQSQSIRVNGYKFPLLLLAADYLPPTFSFETTWSWLTQPDRLLTHARKFHPLDKIRACPLTYVKVISGQAPLVSRASFLTISSTF